MRFLKYVLLLLIALSGFYGYSTYQEYQSVTEENQKIKEEIGEVNGSLTANKAEAERLQQEYNSLLEAHQGLRGEYDLWAARIEALKEQLPD